MVGSRGAREEWDHGKSGGWWRTKRGACVRACVLMGFGVRGSREGEGGLEDEDEMDGWVDGGWDEVVRPRSVRSSGYIIVVGWENMKGEGQVETTNVR